MKRKTTGFVAAAVALAAGINAAELPPLMMIRLRAPHTADDAQWAKTRTVLVANRGACDEVWFSTGIGVPTLAWHAAHAERLARYAAELRAAGIVPSLQVQATLGHSDELSALEGTPAKTWGGFTGRGGTECRHCNCPRQPDFLAYVREMSRLYASFKPRSVWIDDDLRVAGHAPGSPWGKVKDGWIGCWCPTCLAAFNAEMKTNWTRETLDAAMAKDTKLFDRWEAFSFAGIAAVARAIAEEFHKVSPTTRLAYQHGDYRNDSLLAVFRALHEATGLPVGSRPGGGAYYDQNPNLQMIKAFGAAYTRKQLGNPDWIDTWCPEVETYPRAFASRTAQGIMNEAFVNLALGMNTVSLLIMDTRYETDAWYGECLLAPLAAERSVLEGYRKHNEGSVPVGLKDATTVSKGKLYEFALVGVPVVPGVGKTFGEVTNADLSFNLSAMSSRQILDLRQRMDTRAGGKLPVIAETPSVGLVIPRMAPDGVLRSVAFINARIDVQPPITLRLRGVAPDKASATWHALRAAPVTVPLVRADGETRATLPPLAAWNCGWLEL
ncbi:MAG: hypothetical protein ACOX7Q_08795 [Kiritimatiellia bacterium]|jgi:hypothetical protein|nr:hypothetical protein [Lentisphaerota bacterium]